MAWNVAATSGAPIRCRRVDILLSTDGGETFPTVLAQRTRNDGSKSVPVPVLDTAMARIQVACSDNVFLPLSPGNFTIESRQ